MNAGVRDISDAEITDAVETELLVDQMVLSNYINVDTADGIVTLSGTVDNILARDRAERLAEAVVGVRAVVNDIEVESPAGMKDSELRNAVNAALIRDPAADSYELEVEAKDGVVTLEGTVDSWAEKRLSGEVAKKVKGVEEIRNEIGVDYESDRADIEIEKEVETRLKHDIRVDDYLVDVEVTGGEVSLSGTVGSLHEKNRAYRDAWVAGVEAVEADDLDIEWWARNKMRRKSMFKDMKDSEIEEAVKDALLYDPRVMSFNPEVKVDDGTVILSGVVDNLEAKKAAESDARNTTGVWRVKNNLKVRPAKVPADEAMEDLVADALLWNPYVEKFDIGVTASNGVVYLSGKVNTSFEKNEAARVARRVNGVVAVINNIEAIRRWTFKPDWEIEENVKDQLFWSPFVDSDDISVTVDEGIVTLAGAVQTWSELQDAEKNAFEGGAKDVINRLTVTYKVYGPYYPYDVPGTSPYSLYFYTP